MNAMPGPRRLRLQVRDADLRIVAAIDRYEMAELVPKFNPVSLETCGTFVIRLPLQVRDLGSGRLRSYRAAARLLEDGAGIVAGLDGTRFFSGFVEEPERSRSGSGIPHLEVFGYSDDSLFAGRDARPVPSSDVLADQDAVAEDVRRGVAETVIKAYWTANVGPAARPSQRIPGIVIPPSTGLGVDVTGRARFDNLAALTSDLCSRGGGPNGLGWRVIHRGNELRAEVFAPRDRSKHARFSPALRNLESYRFTDPRRTVTDAVVAGGGQGVNRLFRGQQVPAAWWEYRTAYIDRRRAGGGADAPLTVEERAEIQAELDQEAADALTRGAPPATFTAPVQDTPAVGFLRQYEPLDRVTVSVEGVPLVDVVRQVSVKATPGRLDIRPTIGAPDQGPDAALARRLRAVEDQIARLERST